MYIDIQYTCLYYNYVCSICCCGPHMCMKCVLVLFPHKPVLLLAVSSSMLFSGLLCILLESILGMVFFICVHLCACVHAECPYVCKMHMHMQLNVYCIYIHRCIHLCFTPDLYNDSWYSLPPTHPFPLGLSSPVCFPPVRRCWCTSLSTFSPRTSSPTNWRAFLSILLCLETSLPSTFLSSQDTLKWSVKLLPSQCKQSLQTLSQVVVMRRTLQTAALSCMNRLWPTSLPCSGSSCTLYATVLPQDTALRVWDAILLEGSEVVFYAALVVWRLFQR